MPDQFVRCRARCKVVAGAAALPIPRAAACLVSGYGFWCCAYAWVLLVLSVRERWHDDDPSGTTDWFSDEETLFVLPAVDRKHLADVGTLTGSCTRSCYCFDSTQVEGELHVRWLPCGCPNCCSFSGSECDHRGEVGVPFKQVVAEASQAGYGARYTYRIAETNRLADEAKVDDFVVVAPPNGHTDDFWIARR